MGEGRNRTVGNVVELNEIDVAERPGAEVDQSLHLGIGVVDAVDHGKLVRWAAAGLLNIELDGLVEPGKRVLLHARHELVACSLDGRVQRNRKRKLFGKLSESANAGDNATGGDGEMARSDGESIGIVERSQRVDRSVEVSEGLTLTHEDNARNALAEVTGDMEHLIDHFLSRQRMGKAGKAGRTKGASMAQPA